MTRPFAVEHAAATLAAARRVLVTGCGGIAMETVARACDLAEAVGAAVDFGAPEMAQAAGPTIARIGEVTAAPEELRDRADLVVSWFCDPATDAPGFVERFVTPATVTDRPRRTISVGPGGAAHSGLHLAMPPAAAVDLARLLHAAVDGRDLPAPPPLAAARDALHEALTAACCVAFVTCHHDPVGVGPWSLVGLVRALSREKPAFEVPLAGEGGAAAVCTWRYGAAGGIARADRDGARFRPAEGDAVRLIRGGEVDCVVVVGRESEPVEAALAARGAAVEVIRVPIDDAATLDALVAAARAVQPAGGPA